MQTLADRVDGTESLLLEVVACPCAHILVSTVPTDRVSDVCCIDWSNILEDLNRSSEADIALSSIDRQSLEEVEDAC